jgi:hypothetical protein
MTIVSPPSVTIALSRPATREKELAGAPSVDGREVTWNAT